MAYRGGVAFAFFVAWGDLLVGFIVGMFVGWWLHMAAVGEKPDTTPPR